MNRLKENEIERCLLCADAPCGKACPKDLDPSGRIRSLFFKDPYKAYADLPEDPCRDCDGACEKACVLKDEPIRIRELIGIMNELQKEAETVKEDFEPDLSCDICGVRLEHPFLLSSSVVASDLEMLEKAFALGWAGCAFKTICSFHQHEASPRFSALKSRNGSFYGFKNIEQLSDHAVEEDLMIFRKLKEKYPDKVIIASLMGMNEAEWEELTRKCDEAGADVIELNFSCPNMEDDSLGKTISQSEELVERFTRAARKGTKKPLLVKLTPNVADMVPYAKAAIKAGADGVAAINTILSITGVNLDTLAPEPSVRGYSATGGYSGNAVKPIALRFISDLSSNDELKGIHISGMGGIENWNDGLEFLLLGAGSLQITTAVMQYGYRIIDDLLAGLKGYMKERNIGSVRDLIGAAAGNVIPLDELERDTVLLPKFDPDTCVGCGRCYISCFDGGHQAIAFDPIERRPKLQGKRCVGCHLCKLVCPTGSITTVSKRFRRI